MEYIGKLYGKVGGEYFPMEETTKDIDKLKARIGELEGKLKSMVSSSNVSKRSELLAFLDWLYKDDIADQKTKETIVDTYLSKS